MGIGRYLAPVLVALMLPCSASADPFITGGPNLFTLTSTSTRIVHATERDINAASKHWRATAERRLEKLRKRTRDLSDMKASRDDWRWLAQQPAPAPTWVWPAVAVSGTLGIAVGVLIAVMAGG